MRFGRNSQKDNKVSVAICFHSAGMALAYAVIDDQNSAAIQHCEHYPFSPNAHSKEKLSKLKNIVEAHSLYNAMCTWILLPTDYKSFVLNKPNVPENEQNNALKWQVRDKISFPIEQALVDSYALPGFGSTETKRQVFVSDTKALLETKQLIEHSGLQLTAITVVEMALRNIANLYTQPEEVTILVHLSQVNSKLLVFYQDKIYFVRQLNININSLNAEHTDHEGEKAYQHLYEQIQQSWEYIIRQANETLKASVVFMPLDFKSDQLVNHLKSQMSLAVILADLNAKDLFKNPLTAKEQVENLWVLGILLSQKEDSNANH